MSKVNRFSLEERYGYQNRKVIYDKNADNDIELNSIYPIIDLLNKYDKQIAELQKQLEEKEKIIQMQQNIKRYDIGEILTENIKLKQQLQSQPAEIVEKIRNICCIEDKCKDGSFVLGINEKDLDTILKKCQK